MKASVFCLLALSMLMHCGKKSDDAASNLTAGDELTGTWEVKCAHTDGYLSVSAVASDNKNLTMTVTNYDDDATCTTETSTMKMVYTYKVGEAVATGKALDLTTVSCEPEESTCPKGTVDYSFYKVTGKELTLGSKTEAVDGTTAEKRYVEAMPFVLTKK